MDTSKELKQQLKSAFTKAINLLVKEYTGSSLTDLFVVVDKEMSELAIYDDEGHCAFRTIISAWETGIYEGKDDDLIYIADIKAVLSDLNDEDAFSTLDLFKPFSINYADDDMIVIEELLVIDDDSLVRIDDNLMKKIDKEFDDFLERLMKD